MYTHTHTFIYNACFHVVQFEGKIHLLLSHFPVFPHPVCEPISCLQPASPVIQQSRSTQTRYTHLQHMHTHTYTMKLITACSGKEREWFRHVGAEAQKIFIVHPLRSKVAGHTAPRSVQSRVLHRLLPELSSFIIYICEEVSCQRPWTSQMCLKRSFNG